MKRLIKLSRLSIALVIYMACASYDGPAMAQRLDAGNSHTCTLLTSGAVSCWGSNGFGQLGNGRTIDSSVPVTVNDLGAQATAVHAGSQHTCALLSTGAVRCWGRNNAGQLGDGRNTNSPVPVTVNNLGGVVTQISAGGNHTCAKLSTGAVQCWGDNPYGQLGDGTNRRSTEPVTVNNLGASAIIIACGGEYTCAILTTGVLRCWGRGSFGELGNGRISHSRVPVTVGNLGGQPTAVALGTAHTCAILLSGEVRCWGNNQKGQLGNGRTTHSLVPVSLSNVKNR